ncbi:4Fe-4S binding protein [Methanogenium sp. S4BF]|uniref:4Fe-4S binding protein n=1 Tax=Methanogenium sp. S4BF TaxID=1789226 RepID=UPI002416364F|nr:4Fe-4S binding protein [Methanogenium sp. S4BF]WFN34458.1 4Fe-4S binding protein [Methanogenium sp. S4BF]
MSGKGGGTGGGTGANTGGNTGGGTGTGSGGGGVAANLIPRAAGFAYAIIVVFALAILWYTGKINRKKAFVFLLISTALGFLIFAPVAPHNFQQLILRDAVSLGASLQVAAAGLTLMLILSLVFGRIFCGHICPAGAVQELASLVPLPKCGQNGKLMSLGIRAVVFVIVLAAAFGWSVGIIDYFGLKEFFSFDVTSVLFYVFLGVLLLSMVVYRPFCRFICPYGLLLSLTAAVSAFKFRRTDTCIQCGRCERACPTDEAKVGDRKSECYMCGRCVEVCPVAGALVYRRSTGRWSAAGIRDEKE